MCTVTPQGCSGGTPSNGGLIKEQPIRSSRGVDTQTPQSAVLKHPIFNSVFSLQSLDHLWSKLSKKLACVRLSAIADGDNKAPYYISGISDEEKKAKQASVFDEQSVKLQIHTGITQCLTSFQSFQYQ